MEKAFNDVFLRSLSRALRDSISDPKIQSKFSAAIRKGVKSGTIPSKLITENLDGVILSCLGTLSADISLRSVYEKQEDPLQVVTRLISEELVRTAGDVALSRLLKGCNMDQALSQLGQEGLEKIAERISTQDVYLKPEFEESLETLKQIIKDAIDG